MNKINQLKAMENRTGEDHIFFFKSQEEFTKALREGVGAADGIGFSEEVAEEE